MHKYRLYAGNKMLDEYDFVDGKPVTHEYMMVVFSDCMETAIESEVFTGEKDETIYSITQTPCEYLGTMNVLEYEKQESVLIESTTEKWAKPKNLD
jgi:hypothetical protein